MEKDVIKLNNLIQQNLHRSKSQIIKLWGKPEKKSDEALFFFRIFKFSLYWDEVTFIFEEDKVIDIIINEYLLWWETKNIYYLEGQTPNYKIIRY